MTYAVDFAKNLTKKTNTPLSIYLILNTIIIGFVLGTLFHTNPIAAFLLGLCVYTISLVIALSPFGEWLLRMQNGCKEIKRKDQIDI